MRALILRVLALALAALAGACGASALTTPTWARSALATDDADVVVAMNVALIRKDPLFYPAIQKLARKDRYDWLLRASQIDAVATVDDGKPSSWVAAVHGLDGAPGDGEIRSLGARRKLASGATEYAYPRGAMLVFPGAWVFAEGAALDRMRARTPERLGRISMQDSAILEATVRARALPRHWNASASRVADGLREGTIAILGGDRLAMIVRGKYVDADAAARAESETRAQLEAIQRRHELAILVLRELVEIDFGRSGDTVTWRVEAKEKLRDYVREYVAREGRDEWRHGRDDDDADPEPPPPGPPPPPPPYPGACPRGQRWDLDRRACVEAR